MKIFGRKRKSGNTPTKERSSFASDPVVEELLTKDASEWNAKEKRMIKRYQKRKEQAKQEEPALETSAVVDKTDDKQPEEDVQKNEEDDKDAIDSSDDGSNGSDDSSDDSSEEESEDKDDSKPAAAASDEPSKDDSKVEEEAASPQTTGAETAATNTEEIADDRVLPDHEIWKILDKLSSKIRRKLGRQLNRDGPQVVDVIMKEAEEALASLEKAEEGIPAVAEIGDATEDGKVPADHEIWKILEKLTSKTKRTLSRKLERLGTTVLADVVKEAKEEWAAKGGIKRSADDITASEIVGSKKSKRRKVDWSSLTPEERTRREEQRKKQQEAAEKRAKEGTSTANGHKHPLNSERRRANRRKPKHKNKSDFVPKGDAKKEHHSSGYLHRRDVQ